MVPVSNFFSRLIPHVIGCPEPLAQQALVDSAIALCDQALVVQVDLEAESVLSDVRDYTLSLPSQQELSQVLRVWLDDELLTPVPSFQVGVIEDLPGQPRYYFSRDIFEVLNVRLFPTPDKAFPDGLQIRVATRPTRDATQVHSSLLNEWVDIVVEGAAARLHDLPGQVFTNEIKAMALYQKVRAKINAARVEALRGRVVSSMSVNMRSF
jgi:hypothetical protein